jgi:hypothetical protein
MGTSNGRPVAEVSRELGINPQTFVSTLKIRTGYKLANPLT